MFPRVVFVASLLLLLVGQVLSLPLPAQRANVVKRSPEPLDTVVVYERGIPSDIAVRWVDGKVVPFSKRDEEELAKRAEIPEEVPTEAGPNGIKPFHGAKRSEGDERWKARSFGRRR